MSAHRLISLAVSLVVGLTPIVVSAQTGDPDSMAILQEIKVQTLGHSNAYSYVSELSEIIGPRLTGSSRASLACKWAMEKMKRAGLQNVHLEPFNIGRAWQREYANAQLMLPYRLGLNISSYGWTGSTRQGGVDAEVVAVNADLIPDEIKQHSKLWKDRILFLTPLSANHLNPIRVYSQVASLLGAATKANAVAVIYGTGRPGELLNHTGPADFKDSSFSIPVVDIAPAHMELLRRMVTARTRIRIKIDVQNTFRPGPIQCSNVIGDLPGSERPDEVVVVAAHLDSWDLATGAVDDGFGVAAVLGAADTILSQHIRARRTIRFVLFTGEEQGLLGSLAYIRTHKAEMKNHVCAFAMDWGSGPISNLPLAGHDELEPSFTHFASLMTDIGEIKVDHTYLSFTDAYAFTLAGVPGIAPYQNSPNYVEVGHSAEDLLPKVDRKNLISNTAVFADLAFWAANYPTRLATQWSHQKIVNVLTRDSQRTLLELFGLWSLIR